MHRSPKILAFSLLFCAIPAVSLPQVAAPPDRQVVVTVDDLPVGAAQFMSGQEITDMTTRLVATLKAQQVPAVGFVNEGKLYLRPGEVDARIAALSQWLDAGLELGNHTFGHTGLNRVSLKDWEEDVVRGETVTRLLLAQHKMKLRFFRHPYLDVGRDLQTRRDAEAFLTSRGYHIAPVTLDPWDWAFAPLYDEARKRGDAALQQKITASFLAHCADMFAYDEKLSRELFGYEPPQILLLHGSNLEAEHIGEVLDLLRKRGYHFVRLDSALTDFAYSTPNDFFGEEGPGWLEQWAVTRGRIPQGEPPFPLEMQKLRQTLLPPPSAPAPAVP
ncbi:MAG: polysaccharide deacetylase family protein [Acidobacteria bacterium]|nr:polysaccharide deacetylase family protein [Acidobacteriota bacterium]MBS1865226.1 polysaccharide deacetylase family protein [Acidobacteriota bacterium]